MILIDLSSTVHRSIHSAISNIKPKKMNGEYITSDFINLVKYYILQDLFNVKMTFSKYNDIVICLDDAKDGYWRRDVHKSYKAHRKTARDASEINYTEVFKEIDELIEQMKNNLPWKVVSVPRTEADDIILVLAHEFNADEEILIYSPDKDMIQSQRDNANVKQYSALTKKWLTPDTKHGTMEQWIQEHCILGDVSDNVPKIVDSTEFADEFIDHLNKFGICVRTVQAFKSLTQIKKHEEVAIHAINNFDLYYTNRNGEKTEKKIFKKMRFGPAALKKKIKEFGSCENWINSNPLYIENYNRNYTLVMREGIPENIKKQISEEFSDAKMEYNDVLFKEYLVDNQLNSIIMELPNIFKINKELSAEDFGW